MIFDRTLNDVDLAKKYLNVLKFGGSLPSNYKTILERGTASLETISRIEYKQNELSAKLKAYGYIPIDLITKQWDETMDFTMLDLERLVNNTIMLRESFFIIDQKQQNPEAEYTYIEFNAIEKILYEISLLIENLINDGKRCGAFYSGAFTLPLKGSV